VHCPWGEKTLQKLPTRKCGSLRWPGGGGNERRSVGGVRGGVKAEFVMDREKCKLAGRGLGGGVISDGITKGGGGRCECRKRDSKRETPSEERRGSLGG